MPKPKPSASAAAHILRSGVDSPAPKLSAQGKSLIRTAQDSQPWTGEEPIQDAVLRMLVDKYKPLKVSGWQKKIPEPTALDPIPSNSSATSENELTDSKPLNPWDYTFKTPTSHVERPHMKDFGSIKRKSDSKLSKTDRLVYAREKVVDRLVASTSGPNKNSSTITTTNYAPLPRSPEAIRSLVDERIEQARKRGLFANLPGRGKPFARDHSAENPFLPNEERILNRIVASQGALPPWIELQKNSENDIDSLRQRWKANWVRRAVRMLGLEGRTDPKGWRDKEWEERERKFHELDIISVNNSIRSYNAMAPYQVRKGLLMRQDELSRMYASAEEEIAELLLRRKSPSTKMTHEDFNDGEDGVKDIPLDKDRELATEWKWSWEQIGLTQWWRERMRRWTRSSV